MDRILWITALLVTAGLAGCTAGDEAGQLPTELPDGDGNAAGQDPGRGPSRQGQGDDGASGGWRGDLFLEVDPKQGAAPLNVTIRYDVGNSTRQAHGGQGQGQGAGNGTSGNATGNQTGTGNGQGDAGASGNATGNQTGGDGNQTAGQGAGASAGSNLTWTLTMWRMQPGDEAEGEDGNATGNGTSSGSATATSTTGPSGNSTGNATGNGTAGGPSGNATGNATGNSTAGGDASGNATDDGFQGEGNLTLVVNGTMADLPGVTTQRVESAGHYMVRFTVDHGNGTTTKRTATVHVREMQDGDPLGNETRVFEGSSSVSAPLVCGSDDHAWVLNATFAGHPAAASQLNVTLESDGFGEWEMTLVAPNGTEVASGPEIAASGPFAPGEYTLTVETCTAVEAAYTATAVAHYVYARVPPSPAPTEPEEDEE